MKKFQATPEDFRIFAKDGGYYFLMLSLMIFLYIIHEESLNLIVVFASLIFSIPLIVLNELSTPERQHKFIVIQMISMIIAVIIYVNSPAIGSDLLKKANALFIILLFYGIYGIYLKRIR